MLPQNSNKRMWFVEKESLDYILICSFCIADTNSSVGMLDDSNVISETRNGAETTYTYDSLDRLLSVTYSDGSTVTYEYDALNNRTKEIYSNGDIKDYVYDTKYQLKEIKLNGAITDTFTYNETGAVVTHNDKRGIFWIQRQVERIIN